MPVFELHRTDFRCQGRDVGVAKPARDIEESALDVIDGDMVSRIKMERNVPFNLSED